MENLLMQQKCFENDAHVASKVSLIKKSGLPEEQASERVSGRNKKMKSSRHDS
jgi:hypothetical protein